MNLEQTHVWSESPVYLCVRSVRDVGGGGFILGNRGCCRVHVGLVDGSNASERIENLLKHTYDNRENIFESAFREALCQVRLLNWRISLDKFC